MTTRPIPEDCLEVSDFVQQLRALESPPVRVTVPPALNVEDLFADDPREKASTTEVAPIRTHRLWRGGLLAAGLAAAAGIRAWVPLSPVSAPRAAVATAPASTPAPSAAAAASRPPYRRLAPWRSCCPRSRPSRMRNRRHPCRPPRTHRRRP